MIRYLINLLYGGCFCVKKIISICIALFICMSNINVAMCSEIGGTNFEESVEVNVPVYKVQKEIDDSKNISPQNKLPVKSAILIEQNTGKVLFEQDADVKLPPASVTKIMTLLFVMEALDSNKISINDKVTCSENASQYGGSQIWLKPNEVMTVDDLIKATAIASANDATVCLAEYLAGSEDVFIAEMNKKAQELGMKNTTFKCIEGLDTEGHLTTARDISIMSRELMKHTIIKNYTTIWMDSLRNGETQLVNTNRLVRFYEGATGLKTGTTSGAGSCISATATRNGLDLIAVIMGADTSDLRFSTARSLLDWGFANYTNIKVEPQPLEPIAVKGGTQETCNIKAIIPQGIVVNKNDAELITQNFELPEFIEAPLVMGDEIGTLTIKVGEEEYMKCPIVCEEDVQKMTFGFALKNMFSQLFKLS